MAKKKSVRKKTKKKVETLTHDEAKRPNIPTAEFQSVMDKDDQSPIRVAHERRNRDLDPHDANWTNRMILGDSLQVMASLAEREGLLRRIVRTDAT